MLKQLAASPPVIYSLQCTFGIVKSGNGTADIPCLNAVGSSTIIHKTMIKHINFIKHLDKRSDNMNKHQEYKNIVYHIIQTNRKKTSNSSSKTRGAAAPALELLGGLS